MYGDIIERELYEENRRNERTNDYYKETYRKGRPDFRILLEYYEEQCDKGVEKNSVKRLQCGMLNLEQLTKRETREGFVSVYRKYLEENPLEGYVNVYIDFRGVTFLCAPYKIREDMQKYLQLDQDDRYKWSSRVLRYLEYSQRSPQYFEEKFLLQSEHYEKRFFDNEYYFLPQSYIGLEIYTRRDTVVEQIERCIEENRYEMFRWWYEVYLQKHRFDGAVDMLKYSLRYITRVYRNIDRGKKYMDYLRENKLIRKRWANYQILA